MIKFLDLQSINTQYSEELKQVASEVIDSGWYLMGQQLEKFENEFSSYIGTKICIGVGNGLEALQLILRAYVEMGVMKKGDEVKVTCTNSAATTTVGVTVIVVDL